MGLLLIVRSYIRSDNAKTPLECRAEAEKFKAAVAGVEKVTLLNHSIVKL
jgi:hypothetical protein